MVFFENNVFVISGFADTEIYFLRRMSSNMQGNPHINFMLCESF